jgi:3-oxoacyl-[acyl-carrier protein] reductase
MNAPLPLADRVAVVTGATGGIGSAVCRRLAESGASVVVGYRSSRPSAEALVGDLPGQRHVALRVDVEDGEEVERFGKDIGSKFSRVDLLVNAVGVTRFVPHHDLRGLDSDLIDQIFRVNWRGPFATIRSLEPLLRRSERALVVNISSIAGPTGMGSNVAYCASKAALNTMTISLARALAPAIRVVSVSPGLVETEFIRGLDPQWLAEQRHRTPLGRLATPEHVADAVLAAATLLQHSTGCIIPVDGGRTIP